MVLRLRASAVLPGWPLGKVNSNLACSGIPQPPGTLPSAVGEPARGLPVCRGFPAAPIPKYSQRRSPTQPEIRPVGKRSYSGLAKHGQCTRVRCNRTQLLRWWRRIDEYAVAGGGGVVRGFRSCPVGEPAADRAAADWAKQGRGRGPSPDRPGARLPALAQDLRVGGAGAVRSRRRARACAPAGRRPIRISARVVRAGATSTSTT